MKLWRVRVTANELGLFADEGSKPQPMRDEMLVQVCATGVVLERSKPGEKSSV